MKNITRRYCSFIIGGIVALAMLGYGIFALVTANTAAGLGCTVGSVFAFTLISCLFLGNNFVCDVVETVFGWGFVQMPGLIFTLDLDGIIWLLTVKLLFWIIGFCLAAAFGILAVLLGAVFSIFVYPFAIVKNFRSNPEEIEL